jgi:hypothetical protein
MDCTNCWNPLSSCTCGQRRPMLAGGVIDPDAYYDGKGTKNDPLKGQHKKLKGYVKKHEDRAKTELKKKEQTNKMPEPLKSFHISQGNSGMTELDISRMARTGKYTIEEIEKMKKGLKK